MSARDTISLDNVISTLRDTDITFAAVPEESITEGYCTVLFHHPVGSNKKEIASALETLDQYTVVTVGDEEYVFQLSDVPHTEIHSHRRIVLFNQNNMYGLGEVSVAQGSENVREFVKNDTEPTPVPSETVDAETLIQELADAGAVAVTLEPTICNEDRLTVTTWLPPATGYDVVGTYRDVKVGDEVFDLQWEFVCHDGISFLNRVPLYASNDIIGMDEIPVSAGLSNLESYVRDGCPSVTAYSPGGEL